MAGGGWIRKCTPPTHTHSHIGTMKYTHCPASRGFYGDTERVGAGKGRVFYALRCSFGASVSRPLLSPGSHPLGWAGVTFVLSGVSQAGHKPGAPQLKQMCWTQGEAPDAPKGRDGDRGGGARAVGHNWTGEAVLWPESLSALPRPQRSLTQEVPKGSAHWSPRLFLHLSPWPRLHCIFSQGLSRVTGFLF